LKRFSISEIQRLDEIVKLRSDISINLTKFIDVLDDIFVDSSECCQCLCNNIDRLKCFLIDIEFSKELRNISTNIIVDCFSDCSDIIECMNVYLRKFIESVYNSRYVLCLSSIKFRYEIIDVLSRRSIEMRSNICNIVNDSRINLSENRQRLCYRKHSVRTRRIELKTGDSLSDSTNHKCYVSCVVLSDSLTLEHRHTISKRLNLIA
jgi:hypothetical protein